MKMITAIIRNSKIDALNVALNEIGVHGMTTTYVNGYGKQKGQPKCCTAERKWN